jgi:glycosyltransferase involved in cell wall biosynthesis
LRKIVERSLVSFIIPVLNGEKDIGRCLDSIRRQESPSEEYEIIVMDNGSTDKTHQIVRGLGFDFQIVLGVRVGALRNRGVARARGDYVAFVDADVELMPCWLRAGLAAFDNSYTVAAGCFPKVPLSATWVQQTWDIQQRGSQHNANPKPVSWLPSMNLIVRRSVFLEVGGFNEQLETAEDVDLCYRLGQRGTILCNPTMEAIHWGEAPDLRTFWRKEVWRGKGNLKGVVSHGLRWDELPSVGYPLYILCFLLALCISCVLDVAKQHFVFTPFSFGMLILPALMLALTTMRRARRPRAFLRLFLLYLVYGFARAYSIVNTRAHRRA